MPLKRKVKAEKVCILSVAGADIYGAEELGLHTSAANFFCNYLAGNRFFFRSVRDGSTLEE